MKLKAKIAASKLGLFTAKTETKNNAPIANDNYILIQKNDTPFMSVQDLNGNVDSEINVIHRFENGKLLTYMPFSKTYKSSDLYTYDVNYNVYSVYDFDTKKSVVLNIIQADNILNSSKAKVRKVKDFMGKQIFSFNNLMFSDVFEDSLIVTGSHFNLSKISSQSSTLSVFGAFAERKIWGIADLTAALEFNGETEAANHILDFRTFKEVEFTMFNLVSYDAQGTEAEQPFSEINKAAEHVFTAVVNNDKIKKHFGWNAIFGTGMGLGYN